LSYGNLKGRRQAFPNSQTMKRVMTILSSIE